MELKLREWKCTTPDAPWREGPGETRGSEGEGLVVSSSYDQTVTGFGGCFNELGMVALSKASPSERARALAALFGEDEGCGFELCRAPIGASDYALDWYSLDESPEDYELRHFSLERDRKYLIPYIKEALCLAPGLKLFASPWSPPTWMKSPSVYNSGRLRMEEQTLRAYALYFLKYVRAYRAEGIEVARLFIQNEPFADTKYPSCLWSPEQFAVFFRDYIGPLFERERESAELWLGTLNGPKQMALGCPSDGSLASYDDFVDRLLLDDEVARYIRGVGFQWEGRTAVQRTRESYPALKLMQTENECGDGRNSWEYAFYVFGLMRHYLANGVDAYAYWNMILEEGGSSSWGWKQNSMISVDPATGRVKLNPEYYVMKHFSRFAPAGSRRRLIAGRWAGASTAFERPDGSLAVVAGNLQPRVRSVDVVLDGAVAARLSLEPRSINTLVFGA